MTTTTTTRREHAERIASGMLEVIAGQYPAETGGRTVWTFECGAQLWALWSPDAGVWDSGLTRYPCDTPNDTLCACWDVSEAFDRLAYAR